MAVNLVYEGDREGREITSASFTDYNFRLWCITSPHISLTEVSCSFHLNGRKKTLIRRYSLTFSLTYSFKVGCKSLKDSVSILQSGRNVFLPVCQNDTLKGVIDSKALN